MTLDEARKLSTPDLAAAILKIGPAEGEWYASQFWEMRHLGLELARRIAAGVPAS